MRSNFKSNFIWNKSYGGPFYFYTEFFNLKDETTDAFPFEIAANLLNKFEFPIKSYSIARADVEICIWCTTSIWRWRYTSHTARWYRGYSMKKRTPRISLLFLSPHNLCTRYLHSHGWCAFHVKYVGCNFCSYMVYLLVRQSCIISEYGEWERKREGDDASVKVILNRSTV